MSRIAGVHAREIIDSRGNPTSEAVELRDGDAKRYLGKGVTRAVDNVNTLLREALIGREADDQAGLDARMIELDGTETKSRLGANALLSVSLANAHAAAADAGQPLFKQLGGTREALMPVP